MIHRIERLEKALRLIPPPQSGYFKSGDVARQYNALFLARDILLWALGEEKFEPALSISNTKCVLLYDAKGPASRGVRRPIEIGEALV